MTVERGVDKESTWKCRVPRAVTKSERILVQRRLWTMQHILPYLFRASSKGLSVFICCCCFCELAVDNYREWPLVLFVAYVSSIKRELNRRRRTGRRQRSISKKNWGHDFVFGGKTKAPFTSVRANFCTDKNLHGSTLRLHGTGRTGRIFERLKVSRSK